MTENNRKTLSPVRPTSQGNLHELYKARQDNDDKTTDEARMASFESEVVKDGEVVKDTPAADKKPEKKPVSAAAEKKAEEVENDDSADDDDDDTDDTERADDQEDSDTPAGDADPDNSEGGPKDDAPKKKQSLKARVKEINIRTREMRESERRVDEKLAEMREIERRIAAGQPAPKPAADQSAAQPDVNNETALVEMQKRIFGAEAVVEKPNPEKFKFGELDTGYIEAISDWRSQRTAAKQAAFQDQQRQAGAADAKRREITAKRDKLIESGSEKYDDFYEKVVHGADTAAYKVSLELAEMIFDSDVGDDVAYFLASDPKEADRIFDLSPVKQGIEFARLEARFKSQSPKSEDTDADDELDDEARPEQPEKLTVKPPKAPAPPKNSARGAGGRFGARTDSDDFEALQRAFQTGEIR